MADEQHDIHYLTPAEIYAINEQIVGHRPAVRDRHLLRAAMARPMIQAFGQEAYPTVYDKAAAILHSLAYHHLFGDGNKRTARHATVRFLQQNGLQPTWTEREAYDYILEVAQGKLDVPEIAAWLEIHTRAQDES